MSHVIEIKNVQPYKLKFDTNEILEINLESRIIANHHFGKTLYMKLLEPDYFKSVKLNNEMRSIYWDNGLDFCPDVLYMMGKKIPFTFNDGIMFE